LGSTTLDQIFPKRYIFLFWHWKS